MLERNEREGRLRVLRRRVQGERRGVHDGELGLVGRSQRQLRLGEDGGAVPLDRFSDRLGQRAIGVIGRAARTREVVLLGESAGVCCQGPEVEERGRAGRRWRGARQAHDSDLVVDQVGRDVGEGDVRRHRS